MKRSVVSIACVIAACVCLRLAGSAAPVQASPQAASSPCIGGGVYGGAPIDVDFQGTDLRTTLRLLADTGGINLVVDPSVPLPGAAESTVDVKLTQVPWDQVLSVVLRASKLTCVADGTVIRVLTRERRTQELEQQALQRQASEQVPGLEKLQLRLNYADATAMSQLLKNARILSARGTADVDKRTNTVIVKDVAANLADVQDLLRSLDAPEPQVEIEAQIVQTNHESARALGVQWGFNGRLNQELGNTTGLGFPNNGAVGGRTGTQQGAGVGAAADPRASALDKNTTAVNLPAGVLGNPVTSAAGLTLGAVNGAFSLDVALSALEHKGETRILSSPKVVTQNNQEAVVMTGARVPIQTVSNNTVVTQYVDAALKLTVKPQITAAAGTVMMNILLENGSPDFSRSVNGNPTIFTQTAETAVLVPNGATVVIGGIRKLTNETANDQTPGLGNVPLLGWLFRRNERSANEQELLIFITPRVLPAGRP